MKKNGIGISSIRFLMAFIQGIPKSQKNSQPTTSWLPSIFSSFLMPGYKP
ncbi:hypothetical protein VS86_02652 [Vibrio cholerae]|nr:hypothetical protein VS86_02652 [Vibrio cholerae]